MNADIVGFENFALGTLFKDVSFLSSNQTKLEGESQQYAYRAFLYALINGSYSAKKFQLQVAGWMKDTPGKVDAESTTDDAAKPKQTGNEGFLARRAWTKGGGKLELCGPVFLDTWMQRQYFIDDQDYQLTFKLNEPKFALHANKNDVAYKINIEKMCLYLRQVNVSPQVMLGHAKGLQHHNIIIPFNAHKVFTKMIVAGVLSDVSISWKASIPSWWLWDW